MPSLLRITRSQDDRRTPEPELRDMEAPLRPSHGYVAGPDAKSRLRCAERNTRCDPDDGRPRQAAGSRAVLYQLTVPAAVVGIIRAH